MNAETGSGKPEQSMRPFFIIWGGQVFSLLGSQLVQFAVVWWLTRETGSATVLATASLAALLPQIVLGPFAGALVDRWSRRAILLAADGLTAAATLALALLFLLGQAQVWAIYLLLLARSAAGAFHWPAMQASVTLLVPAKHLARVAGLNQSLAGLAGIFIPPLGALAMELLPMQAVLGIDVLTAVPAMLCLLFTRIPNPARVTQPQAAKPSMLADLREGLRFLLGWRGLLYLALVGLLVGVLGRAAASLVPLMVTQVFGGGAAELGWWESGYGAGIVLGGLALSAWAGFKRRIFTSMLALALDGVVCLLIALSPRELFALTVLGMAALGILEAMIFGLNGAIGQAVVPPEMQGRVFSLIISATQLAAPLGLLVAGPFADAYGVRAWWLLSASLITATGIWALLTPALMRIEEGPLGDWRLEIRRLGD